MVEPEPWSERRMSDVEALMWNLEKDPFLQAAFANVTVFDRPVDVDRLRARMGVAVQRVPRLRQKVVASLGRLAPPEWVDDPDFDLDFHIRRVALPAPGTDRQLYDLAAILALDPFDRTRPLWEFVVIDGLDGGRGAMLQKMHHAITDGEGGVRMSVEFLDLERDAEGPPPPDPGAAPTAEDRNLWDSARDTVDHDLRRVAGIARRGIENAAGSVVHPTRLAGLPGEVAGTAASLLRQVAVIDERHSPLWTERSLRRYFDTLKVPLGRAKSVAHDLGGSVNDLFVCGAAGAAGAYHRAKGAEVDELRMAMPVSTRTDRSAGGNAFTPARVLVPTTADHRARFAEIHERLTQVRGERALTLAGSLAGVVNTLPTSVLVRMTRRQVETVDFTTSNVRGAPFDLYIAGALITGNYPLGPIGGTAWNLTTLSYRGNLDMGVHVDAAAVDDPALLVDLLRSTFEELLALEG